MSTGTYDERVEYPRSVHDDWDDRQAPARRSEFGTAGLGLPLAGLAVLGLGAALLYYMGPDLVRYLKLRSM